MTDDPRRRSLSRPGLRRRLLERIRRPRNAPSPQPPPPPLEPAGEVMCAAFHTMARDTRSSGHLQMSRFAGQLQQLGVPHTLTMLLMRPGHEARNHDTVERFVHAVGQRRPAFVVLYAAWLPWLADRLRDECGVRVVTLDRADVGDVPAGLAGLDPHVAVAAAAGPLRVSLLLHRTDPDAHDRVVRVPGAFAQATSGLRELARLGRGQDLGATVAVVAVIDVHSAGRLAAFAPLARDLGATELRLLVRTADLPLDRLDAVVADVDLALAAGQRAGLGTGFECATGPIWVEPSPV